jgi:hypothetical protein
MTEYHPPGTPESEYRADELADVLALADGSVWTYEAEAGAYVALAGHEGVTCTSAAAVIEHTGGPVRPAQSQDYPREDER